MCYWCRLGCMVKTSTNTPHRWSLNHDWALGLSGIHRTVFQRPSSMLRNYLEVTRTMTCGGHLPHPWAGGRCGSIRTLKESLYIAARLLLQCTVTVEVSILQSTTNVIVSLEVKTVQKCILLVHKCSRPLRSVCQWTWKMAVVHGTNSPHTVTLARMAPSLGTSKQ